MSPGSRISSGLRRALGRGHPGPPAATDADALATIIEPWDFGERTLLAKAPPPSGPATEILFSRLDPSDVSEVESRLEGERRAIWEATSTEERKRLTLSFGLHYGVPGVVDRSGLSAAMPPAAIHSMASRVETGGSYYYSDAVLEQLKKVGRPLAAGSRALDFGCSSGRVVRALAAARPDAEWQGCDPNEAAILWAREQLPGIHFFASNNDPPLPHDPGELDLVLAISVWSHMNEAGAMRWLGEMHRVIRPGGQLIFTTHGFHACLYFSLFRDDAIAAKLGQQWLVQTWRMLESRGHCFWSVFEQGGDWGVVNQEWGLAFFTPEWLLEHVTPAWALTCYRIGRAQGCQDLYTLERR